MCVFFFLLLLLLSFCLIFSLVSVAEACHVVSVADSVCTS